MNVAIDGFMKGFSIGKPIGAAVYDVRQAMKHDHSKGVDYAVKAVKTFGHAYKIENRAPNSGVSNRGAHLR